MPTPTTLKPSTSSTPSRVTRSISFPKAVYDYVKRRAEKEKRSFNWIVTNLVENDLRSGESKTRR